MIIRLLFLSLLLLANSCALQRTHDTVGSGIDDVRLQPIPLAEGVWYVEGLPEVASATNQGFISNAGIIATPEGTLIVDALGTPALGRSLMRVAESLTGKPVRGVVLTHYHSDHFYGAQPMQEAGAEVWARAEGQQYLRSEIAAARLAQRREILWPWVDESTQLVVADQWLDLAPGTALEFPFGGRSFRLISGGAAHSPEDTMLLVEDVGVLFAGDLYFTGRLPFVVGSNTREWLRDLDTIEALAPKTVVPGHGPASSDVTRDIQITRGYIAYLRARMGEAVEELLTFEEAYAAADWSPFASLPTFAQANRSNAYSVYLEMQGEMLAP